MKTITAKKLIDAGCCESGVERYFGSRKRRHCDELFGEALANEDYSDCAYALSLLMSHRQRVRWAIWSAESVVQHAQGPEAKAAINAAKAWLQNPCAETRAAARDAAGAAWAAGDAAGDAARAAGDAMYRKTLKKGYAILQEDTHGPGEQGR